MKWTKRNAALPGVAAAVPALLLAGFVGVAGGADAKQVYDVNCASCHGADGKGDGPAGKFLNPKPRDFSTALAATPESDVAKMISLGGAALGKSALMPPYASKLSEDEIQALAAYVKAFGAK